MKKINLDKIKISDDQLKYLEIFTHGEELAKLGYYERNWQTGEGYWSDGFYRILGEKPGEVKCTHDDFIKYIHPDDLKRVNDHIESTLKNQTNMDIEFRVVQANGNIIHIHGIGKSFFDKTGKPINTIGAFKDITIQKEFEVELKESEKRLSLIIDESPFPIAVADINDEKILYWSQNAVNIFGHSPDFVSEWYNLAYPDPEYRKQVIKRWKPMLHKAQATGKVVNTGEYEVTCKDGSIKVCELYAQFIPGNLIVTFNEITERKKVEQALKESEKKYKTLFENIPIMLGILDQNGKYQEVNSAVFHLLGYDNDILKGDSSFEYIHEEDRDSVIKAFSKALKSGSGEAIYRFKHANGDYRIIRTKASSMQNTGNFICFSEDITEQKRADKALKESEEKYSSLVNNMPELVYTIDRNNKVQFLNHAASALLGKTPDQVIGKSIYNLFKKEVAEQYINDLQTVFKTGKPIFNELQTEIAGQKLWIYVSLTPIIHDGEISTVVGITRDVTSAKNAELALKESIIDLKLAQKIANIGNWKFDPEIGVPEWSDFVYEIYERNPSLGPPHIDEYKKMYEPDQYKVFSSAINNAINNGVPYNIELKLKLGNDKIKWINAICQPDKEKKSAGHFLRGTIQDITKQKKAEAEIENYKLHLEELVKERTNELELKNKELERFNKLFVGREHRIKELRDRVKELEDKLNEE